MFSNANTLRLIGRAVPATENTFGGLAGIFIGLRRIL